MKVMSRVFIVLLCYAISAYGFLFILWMSSYGLLLNVMAIPNIPLTLIAWVCHFLICLQWIFNHKINQLLIKIAVFCGLLSFLFMPFIMFPDFSPMLQVFCFEIVLTSPCLCLIIYIIRQNSLNKNKQIIT